MYRYDLNATPPAAYLPVQITNPDTGAAIGLPAKIDSGAAMFPVQENTASVIFPTRVCRISVASPINPNPAQYSG